MLFLGKSKASKGKRQSGKHYYTSSSSVAGSEFLAFNSASSTSSHEGNGSISPGESAEAKAVKARVKNRKDVSESSEVPKKVAENLKTLRQWVPTGTTTQDPDSNSGRYKFPITNTSDEMGKDLTEMKVGHQEIHTSEKDDTDHGRPPRPILPIGLQHRTYSLEYKRQSMQPSTEVPIPKQWPQYKPSENQGMYPSSECQVKPPHFKGLPYGVTQNSQILQGIQRQMIYHFDEYNRLREEYMRLANSIISSEENATGQLKLPPRNDYLEYYKLRNGSEEIKDNENAFLAYSRMQTIKSNRSSSVPLAVLQHKASERHSAKQSRVSSVGRDFTPNLPIPNRFSSAKVSSVPANGTPEGDKSNEDVTSVYSYDENESQKIVSSPDEASGIYGNHLQSSFNRQISDYNKYLFEESEAYLGEYCQADVNRQSNLGESGIPVSDSIDIERRSASSSSNSCGSIQSENATKFSIKKINDESTKVPRNDEDSNIRDSIGIKVPSSVGAERVPVQPGPTLYKQGGYNGDPEIYETSNLDEPFKSPSNNMDNVGIQHPPFYSANQLYKTGGSTSNVLMSSVPMKYYSNTEYQGNVNLNRSRYSAPNINHNGTSLSLPYAGGFNPSCQNRMSLPVMSDVENSRPHLASSIDPDIKLLIIEFVNLRKLISSGNKSFDFRLKWVKMLISATNNELYTFINIKGESSDPRNSEQNRHLFVKSSVTHLLKIIKDADTKASKNEVIYSEVFCIYATLLRHGYGEEFYEDFGIKKDINLCLDYLTKSLELNPNNFKALYQLGLVFEYEYRDFEQALENYKLSAKLGYHKAIYKIALLYIHIPGMRSIKYFRYLHNLSRIDLNSNEIQLEKDDKDDLQRVISLAFYQLGNVYEGIYPSDLLEDDDFLHDTLEVAPVNYGRSLTCYNKSASLGCTLAQVKLGEIYMYGELDRPKNASKSVQWYFKVANSPLKHKRHPDAMLGLSRWYLCGTNGMSRKIPYPDYSKAIEWCQQAIEEFNSANAFDFMRELTENGPHGLDLGV